MNAMRKLDLCFRIYILKCHNKITMYVHIKAISSIRKGYFKTQFRKCKNMNVSEADIKRKYNTFDSPHVLYEHNSIHFS